MSRATPSQIAACRAVLATVAARIPGAEVFAKDELRVGDDPVARRLGHTILVSEVWVGSARVHNSVTFFAHEAVESIVAAVSVRVATHARIEEVDHAA